jgi:hypothetical protein
MSASPADSTPLNGFAFRKRRRSPSPEPRGGGNAKRPRKDEFLPERLWTLFVRASTLRSGQLPRMLAALCIPSEEEVLLRRVRSWETTFAFESTKPSRAIGEAVLAAVADDSPEEARAKLLAFGISAEATEECMAEIERERAEAQEKRDARSYAVAVVFAAAVRLAACHPYGEGAEPDANSFRGFADVLREHRDNNGEDVDDTLNRVLALADPRQSDK